jgi:hypothetical protein
MQGQGQGKGDEGKEGLTHSLPHLLKVPGKISFPGTFGYICK